MKSLINIEIKNSFNKKDDFQKNTEGIFNNNISTLNSHKSAVEVFSRSMGSITASQLQDDFKVINNKKDKNGFLREIIIGVVGTVLGALIIYFIFGIK
jgi:hypothetical protein